MSITPLFLHSQVLPTLPSSYKFTSKLFKDLRGDFVVEIQDFTNPSNNGVYKNHGFKTVGKVIKPHDHQAFIKNKALVTELLPINFYNSESVISITKDDPKCLRSKFVITADKTFVSDVCFEADKKNPHVLTIHNVNKGYKFSQTSVTISKEGDKTVWSFIDNYTIYCGKVTFDPKTNTYSAESPDLTCNYENVCLIANMGLSSAFWDNYNMNKKEFEDVTNSMFALMVVPFCAITGC